MYVGVVCGMWVRDDGALGKSRESWESLGVGSSVPPRVSLGSIFGDILSHKATETTN